ncbi:biosynthetic-type acetolactate synthase large subunit [Anaerotignum lactatifermentans]|uniref:Acetolactate synthase n=1 Tax=Anaerotignum lactatifermentans TaxID=160404 RepID=A0ABS2G6K3_9FIRM|nr:biosynthetic-type acetolactate synthase large subunit [Anaerotignum lactatifermentans]MBM6828177.1 biosynthetic-type acetolactate synthase large subunit [Anaerotignum lactatifermentans]MBM6876660.1 biosynthetic-type acetolactate synthase large subunit [Anaerotignum lactatifermentans]MBM6949760.1 biosynthetic-type acetolactate synthase large subunit [Anaerotignum lactatifermentans]
MQLTGSQIIMEILLEMGVDTVFGYPGGAALNIYDTLYSYQDRIRHVLTAHEQGAAHAADGYARATGRTGVVFATSGPGATNLVTGIATAFMDSIPMVAITSNVANSLIGRDAFQEVYITGITMPITKHNFFVNKVEDLAHAVREAFRIAETGRKGPVLVDVTKDVSAALCEFEPMAERKKVEMPKAEKEEVEKIASYINQAKRPVIYCGGGVPASDAVEELKALFRKADIPVTYTMMAVGIVGYNDTHSLGMIGMHGSVAANKAVDNADLVLALGTRFSDRVALNMEKFAKEALKVQVDIDESEINKNVIVDMSVLSDVKYFLQEVLPLVEEKKRPDWLEQVGEWRKASIAAQCPAAKLHPREIIGAVCDMTDKETIYVTDVGQHQMWAAQFIKHQNTKAFLTSGGLGTMGFGYGAAIGAQVGCPDKRIVHFTGDASFHMNLNEACTAVSENLPIITVIMNNHVLGMVYQWQSAFYERRYSATTPQRKTDFLKVGEGFGVKTFRAETPEEFREAFAEALKVNGPVWIECIIDQEEKVLPMIPNGGTVADIILN